LGKEKIGATLIRLKDAGIIAILRGGNPTRLYQRGLDLAAMGCKAIEVTLDSPNALDVIKKLRQDLNEEVMIGVGTLLDANQVIQCVNAGAEFALSPICPSRMVEHCHSAGILAVPGVANSTELDEVVKEGALIAKLFPSTDWNAKQLVDVKIPYMPVGGVNQENLWDWLDSGAWCVGMGTHLCGSDLSDSDSRDLEWMQSEQQRARDMFMELQRRQQPT
jgi:Entner-Doudoroff aldolase